MKSPVALIIAVGASILISACARAETDDTASEEPAVAAAAQPDTTGAAMWAYLQEVGYQSNWQPWPGKGELYSGQEPHGMLLTTYLNDVAAGALTAQAGSMPEGAIVVKENYMPDSSLAAVTVMYKRSGYNPEHNDWDANGRPIGRMPELPRRYVSQRLHLYRVARRRGSVAVSSSDNTTKGARSCPTVFTRWLNWWEPVTARGNKRQRMRLRRLAGL